MSTNLSDTSTPGFILSALFIRKLKTSWLALNYSISAKKIPQITHFQIGLFERDVDLSFNRFYSGMDIDEGRCF